MHFDNINEAESALRRLASVLSSAKADLREPAEAPAPPEGDRLPDGDGVEGERRRAEAQLRKAEARYRALVEQIPAVSFIAPLDGTVSELYVSPQIEALLGFTAEEWLRNPILWYSQLHPDDRERWQEAFARTLNAGERFRSDYRCLARDGKVVWIHGEARVVSDEEGRPLFLQGVAFDITESKTAEERLRSVNAHLARARDEALEASRAKSAFLANMSHELRTPLNAIVGFSEMLHEDAEDGGHTAFLPDLKQIHNSAKHLLGMIGGILDLSKIESGKMDLYLETFSLSELIQDAVASVLPLVEENGNALEVECADDIGDIHSDMTKVRQMLFNLLSNAAKFTSSGTVTLRAERLPGPAGGRIRLSIIDTGIGMTPDQQAQLFRSFSQADVTTTRRYGGTGLGLAISQRFCRMMGGQIRVESSLGRGSKFTLEFPAKVVPPADGMTFDEPDLPAIEELPPEDAPALILVIDDDPQVCGLMRRFLAKESWRVVTTVSGAEGLAFARDMRPSAVIIDAALADPDGWSVLTALKADAVTAEIPVILFTLSGDTDHGYALGVSDFLTKPIDWGRLSGLLARYRGNKADSRALIIEDEPADLELLSKMVGHAGWTVDAAENGRAALKHVIDAQPDLILLDLMMHEMDGFELVRLLRKTQAGRSIPVVIVTAKDLTAEDRQQLSGSVEKIIQKKAFGKAELLSELRGLVAAAVPARAVAPARTDGASVPSPLTELRRELERVRSERDAALAQLRAIPAPAPKRNWEAELKESKAREESLTREAEAARRDARDTEQNVKLLQAEVDDAWAKASEVEPLRADLAKLRSELTAAQCVSRALEGWMPAEQAEAAAKQRLLERELELMRQRIRENQDLLAEAKAELTNAKRVIKKLKKPAPAQASPRPTPSAESWVMCYRDEAGLAHKVTATALGIRQWFKQGLFKNPEQVLVGRSQAGPFDPLTSFDEFRDLAMAAPPAELAESPFSAPEPERESVHPLVWLLVLTVGVVTAVLAFRQFWPK
jgi:PAS domain S-box-containing protein